MSTLKSLQREFSCDLINSDNKFLYCKACEKILENEKRFQVVQHINTAKHKERLAKKRQKDKAVQQQLSECMENRVSQFSYDLRKEFLAADIPQWKVNTKQRVPDQIILL